MNANYHYEIGSKIWIINSVNNFIENLPIQQVLIEISDVGTNIQYILNGKCDQLLINESNVYATLEDALATLG